MQDEHLPPVELWVMDVEADDDFERVKSVVSTLFGEKFEWRDDRKGVVRMIDPARAQDARSALIALGARVWILDEDDYGAEPGTWTSLITPEENQADALKMIERYLAGRGGGLLNVAFWVNPSGLIEQTMAKWSDLPERYDLPPWPVWDRIV